MIAMLSMALIMACQQAKTPVTTRFCWALAEVESNCDPCAVNAAENAVGWLQIRPIYLRDVNRIIEAQGLRDELFILSDRADPKKSIRMAQIYLEYYARHLRSKGYRIGYPEIAAIHRHGPGWRPWRQTALDHRRARVIKTRMGIKD